MIYILILPAVAVIAAGWFLARAARQVPVLMYHRVADLPGDSLTVSPELFGKQMDYLVAHDHHTISLSELVDHLSDGKKLPKRPVVLTFDDAYEDNFTNALPVLSRHGMTATVFPIAGFIGCKNDWEDYPGKPECRTMDAGQLREWIGAGMEVGSHTMSHPRLATLSDLDIERELGESKRLLEDAIGQPVDFLCYPYGSFDDRVKLAAKSAGYKAALAIYQGTEVLKNDLYSLRRLRVYQTKPFKDFQFKVSKLHMLNLALHIWKGSH